MKNNHMVPLAQALAQIDGRGLDYKEYMCIAAEGIDDDFYNANQKKASMLIYSSTLCKD